ncbi:MAG TPA: trehalose-phosphatase [Acidobacteriota bacterium]
MPERRIQAAVLNLDGVPTDAASFHARDWKPSGLEWVRELQRAGIPIGLASASQHAGEVLRRAKLLGVAPHQALIVADSISGIQAGRRGGFGLIIGVDRGGHRVALREAGADLVVEDLGELSLDTIEAWFEDQERPPPNLLARWDDFLGRLDGRMPVVALDYDGTLTPIVERPELARIPSSTREALARLAERYETIIISGRARADVQALVGLDNLIYAGSHGFDISGPPAADSGPALGRQLESSLQQAAAWLAQELESIDGVLIENKRFSVAVHYRRVDPRRVAAIERAMDQALARHSGLKKTGGKKIFELRPDIDWDKGKALLRLLDRLPSKGSGARSKAKPAGTAFPIYVGDDDTDEDAFAVLAERGAGVVVTDRPKPTRARYSLQDPKEVEFFLRRLAEI